MEAGNRIVSDILFDSMIILEPQFDGSRPFGGRVIAESKNFRVSERDRPLRARNEEGAALLDAASFTLTILHGR